jgi:hypothetical protein
MPTAGTKNDPLRWRGTGPFSDTFLEIMARSYNSVRLWMLLHMLTAGYFRHTQGLTETEQIEPKRVWPGASEFTAVYVGAIGGRPGKIG